MSTPQEPQPQPFALPPAPVTKPKPWVFRHKVLTGFGVFMLIGAIGSATGGTKAANTASSKPASTATSKPASTSGTATAQADAATAAMKTELKANDGQTPAQITTGFCKAIATKMSEFGLSDAEGNIATASESAQYTFDIASVVHAVHKVGDAAGVTAAGIEGVKQWPALDGKVRSDYVNLNADLILLSKAAGSTYTMSDFPAFEAVNNVMTSTVKSFTADCTA